jgi:hypothetical protein
MCPRCMYIYRYIYIYITINFAVLMPLYQKHQMKERKENVNKIYRLYTNLII